MTTIQICADDFGQDPLINDAILQLFKAKCLSATSVLIDGPHVTSYLEELQKAHDNGLEVGLHFNLTIEFPNSGIHCIKTLYQWILLSQFGLINKHQIRQAVRSQLLKFENLLGFIPDYIDGHQHVHQFNGVGQIIIEEVLHRYSKESRPWIRNTLLPTNTSNIPQVAKCFMLQLLGGRQFKTLLNKMNLATNTGFLGVYGFNASNTAAYQKLVQAWLKNSQSNSLMMCHPAVGVVANDTIGHQRPIEFEYLSSNSFQEDLKNFHISIGNSV